MTQPMRDLHTELTTLPDEWPPAWKPAPGEMLVGKVQRYAQGPTPYGWVHTVLVQEERTGDLWSLWLSSTVLLQQFQQQRPQPGERIGLKYQGKDFEKGYHKYRLLVDRPEAADPLALLGCEDGGTTGRAG